MHSAFVHKPSIVAPSAATVHYDLKFMNCEILTHQDGQ